MWPVWIFPARHTELPYHTSNLLSHCGAAASSFPLTNMYYTTHQQRPFLPLLPFRSQTAGGENIQPMYISKYCFMAIVTQQGQKQREGDILLPKLWLLQTSVKCELEKRLLLQQEEVGGRGRKCHHHSEQKKASLCYFETSSHWIVCSSSWLVCCSGQWWWSWWSSSLRPWKESTPKRYHVKQLSRLLFTKFQHPLPD